MAKVSVYDKLETNFTHNGIILQDVINCTDEEELNSKYILELTHPIDEKGKWENLVEENIIKADGQLFRIHKTDSNLGYVYVYARHIFYDLLHNFLEDVRPTNINGSGALNWILSNTQYPHNFVGMSDIDTLNTQYYIRKNPVEAMLGSDSLVTRWNGELVRDNFNIKLLSSRGANKGAQIAYGKNMLGLEVQRDMDTVITRIMPVGRDGLLLPEKYVDSPLLSNYAFPRIQKIEVDVGVNEETTLEQAYAIMRQACNDLYNKNKIDIPYVNINTNLLLLENTEEYKHLKNLVKVELGDIVSCTDNPLKVTFEAKVIRVKKDILSNKNVEVELGQIRKSFSSRLEAVIKDISDEIINSKSDLTKAIENATNLLTNALGGYVVKRPGELLIMDTEDINTATEVWRWNLNGLGYSGTGINGPYRLAITMDGKINADFITTGTLSAGIVKTGVLSSNDNSTWINLDDGSFNFKDALKWVNNQLVISGIDSGSKVFNSTPTPPYKLNDLWKVTGIAGVDFRICTTARVSGAYVANDWTNITDSKTYTDAIKNLTTGTAISGGITTIDNTKVKVAHSGLGGQYSEMRADGFVRKWQYGEAKYLNDIYIFSSEASTAFMSSEPPAVRVPLPSSFQGRGDSVKVVLATNSFYIDPVSMNSTGRSVENLEKHNRLRLYEYGRNFGASPYIDVKSFIEFTDLWSGDDWTPSDGYRRAGFILIAIGT